MTSLSSVATTVYNPSGLTNFSFALAYSYNGLGVDVNNYGPRHFSGLANIVALEGATNNPADSTITNAIGVSGYVKNASTASNAVGLYGQADCEAKDALVWGLNTRSIDNGFETTVWGAEIDCNITNAASVCKGLDIVGGSSVEPAVTIGLRIGPLGTFANPPKRWARGIFLDDGAAITGLEVGAASQDVSSGSQPVSFYYISRSNTRTLGLTIQSDADGNVTINAAQGGALAVLETGGQKQIMVGAGNGLGFYGKMPVAQPHLSAGASLAEVVTALKSLGLVA